MPRHLVKWIGVQITERKFENIFSVFGDTFVGQSHNLTEPASFAGSFLGSGRRLTAADG